jgi:hypothetical protein
VAIHQLIAIYSRPENHQNSPTIRMGKEKSMKHVPFDFPTNPMIPILYQHTLMFSKGWPMGFDRQMSSQD